MKDQYEFSYNEAFTENCPKIESVLKRRQSSIEYPMIQQVDLADAMPKEQIESISLENGQISYS
eukprot:scaffold2652_cov121-Cylindrotheca_fusiformis.AAC.1